jgi:hypothetical protein
MRPAVSGSGHAEGSAGWIRPRAVAKASLPASRIPPGRGQRQYRQLRSHRRRGSFGRDEWRAQLFDPANREWRPARATAWPSRLRHPRDASGALWASTNRGLSRSTGERRPEELRAWTVPGGRSIRASWRRRRPDVFGDPTVSADPADRKNPSFPSRDGLSRTMEVRPPSSPPLTCPPHRSPGHAGFAALDFAALEMNSFAFLRATRCRVISRSRKHPGRPAEIYPARRRNPDGAWNEEGSLRHRGRALVWRTVVPSSPRRSSVGGGPGCCARKKFKPFPGPSARIWRSRLVRLDRAGGEILRLVPPGPNRISDESLLSGSWSGTTSRTSTASSGSDEARAHQPDRCDARTGPGGLPLAL